MQIDRPFQQATDRLQVRTKGRGLYPITSEAIAFVKTTQIDTGLLTLFCRHTSASLLITENADPDVLKDLESAFAHLAPENIDYLHSNEGTDDMPAHIRAALTQVQISIPIIESRPTLGTWQGIFLFEHRRSPYCREIILHLIGQTL